VNIKKIGNTTFNVKHVEGMSLKEFKNIYKAILKGSDLENIYKELNKTKSNLDIDLG